MLVGMAGEGARVHREEIERKRGGIAQQEILTQEFPRAAGIARPPQPWPKIADRFRALGEEVDYRVLYAAMCSQTHNDAEDLFNTVALGIMKHHRPGEAALAYEVRLRREEAYFARFLMYRSVEYLFRCIGRYGDSYGVRALSDVGSRGYSRVRHLTADLCEAERREQERFRVQFPQVVGSADQPGK